MRAVQDALDVLDAVGSASARVVGLSMGGFTALLLALDHPDRVEAAVVGSCGYGGEVAREVFRAETEATAALYDAHGAAHVAGLVAASPYRLAFRAIDPRGFDEWHRQLAEHSALGSRNTVLGVQGQRPTLPELTPRLADCGVPLLFLVGDEDDPCIDVNVAAKRGGPSAGLAILPKTAHTLNLESPDTFNRVVSDFLAAAELGAWPRRDPASVRSTGGWMR
jgi:pimeloyl-ACP methyl ester carboxylesterase